MTALKRIAIGFLLLWFAGSAILLFFDRKWHSEAVRECQESRPADARATEYAFVTRGILAGMTYDEVAQRMEGAKQSTGLAGQRMRVLESGQSVPAEKDPHSAMFYFSFGDREIRGLGGGPVISERYFVFFDDKQRATRIEYRGVDVSGGMTGGIQQSIDVDLASKTMSEPLRLDWQ